MARTRPRAARATLVQQVARNLVDHCGVREGDRLLLAVSGGADSSALLALVAAAPPAHRWHLEVAHFDHALRPDSKADARAVQERSSELGLACHVGRWSKPRRGEAQAREARYAFLEATAKRRGCAAIVLAHHLEDQVETVLMRLGRGAGLRGWLGMPWRRETTDVIGIVRPLLDVRRAALREVLTKLDWSWSEDATNTDRQLARNRLRHDALPALDAALPPGWMERFAASLGELREVWDPVEREASQLLEAAREPRDLHALRLDPLRRAPERLHRQALQLWLGPRLDGELSRVHLEAAARMIQNGRTGHRLELPGGSVLVREGGLLTHVQVNGLTTPAPARRASRVTRSRQRDIDQDIPDPTSCLAISKVGLVKARAELERRRTKPRGDKGLTHSDAPDSALVDASRLEPPLMLRNPRPGDRVQLLGAPGSRPVRRILQDRKVPERLRAGWPVVADRTGVVWVPGVGIADRVRLGPRSAAALRLRYEPQDRSPRGVAGRREEP